MQRSDFYICNTIPYGPEPKSITMIPKDELAGHVDDLHDKIASLADPWLIVPTGDVALQALTGRKGIMKHRGSIYEYRDRKGRVIKVIPTIHPAATFRQEGWTRRCLSDWRRIASDADFRETRLPEREHFIKPTTADVQDYVEDVRARGQALSIDIETPRKIEIVESMTKRGKMKVKRVRGQARVTCVGFSHEPHFSMTIPTTEDYWGDDLDYVWRWIRDLCAQPVAKILQNGLFDSYWLAAEHACTLGNYAYDTRWMHHAADPLDDHDLAYMASVDTREPYWKDEAKDPDEASRYNTSFDAFATYNGKDVAVQRELGELYVARLKSAGRFDFYQRYYAGLYPALLRMMLHGVRLDETARRRQHAILSAACIRIQDRLTEIAGEPLYGKKDLSGKKLATFLYQTLQLPQQRDRATGNATTREVAIRRLMLRYPKKLEEPGKLILDHRRQAKLSSFIKDGVPDPDGRVRSQYGFVQTLRLSSSKNPKRTGQNLQNVDRELRHLYRPDAGCFFLEVDLSQAESRIVYCLTGDPELIALARLQPWEFDDHNRTAGIVFRAPTDGRWPCGLPRYTVTKDQRRFGKMTRHAGNYGLRGNKFSDELLKSGYVRTPQECDEWIDTLLARDKAIPAWQQRVRQTVLRERAISNGFGHMLNFEYERLSDDLYRRAYAFEPQSSVGMILNEYGFKPLDAWLVEQDMISRINLQTHDSLTISTIREEAWDIWQFLARSLAVERTYYGSTLTIPVTLKIGTTWAGTTEFKQPPTREEFMAAVDALTP